MKAIIDPRIEKAKKLFLELIDVAEDLRKDNISVQVEFGNLQRSDLARGYVDLAIVVRP